MRLHAVAAMSLNRVIGANGRIPWQLPEDLRWFKTLTTGHVLLMGRKTFEAIGRPLPRRETVVLSRSGFQHPGARTIRELPELEALVGNRDVFVCGGAQVYALTLPYWVDLYLTVVQRTVAGDTFFPAFEDRFDVAATLRDCPEFKILHYRRRGAAPAA